MRACPFPWFKRFSLGTRPVHHGRPVVLQLLRFDRAPSPTCTDRHDAANSSLKGPCPHRHASTRDVKKLPSFFCPPLPGCFPPRAAPRQFVFHLLSSQRTSSLPLSGQTPSPPLWPARWPPLTFQCTHSSHRSVCEEIIFQPYGSKFPLSFLLLPSQLSAREGFCRRPPWSKAV